MSCDCKDNDNVLQYIQGDTFHRQVVVKDSAGNVVDAEYIQKVEFLLLTMDATEEETYQLAYDSDISKWAISEDTSNWAIASHLGRYRITYTDGQVVTPYEMTIVVKK